VFLEGEIVIMCGEKLLDG